MASNLPSPAFTIRSTKGDVTTLTFVTLLAGNEELVTGHSTGDLLLWNLKTHRPRITWSAHNGKIIRWVGFSTNQLYSYGADASLNVWDIGSSLAKKTGSLPVNSYTHCPCDITTKEPVLLAIPCDASSINILSANKDKINNLLKLESDQHNHGVLMCVKFVEITDKILLLASYENGSAILWDVDERKCLSELAVHREPMTCIDFHVPTMRGISGFTDDKLVIWKLIGSQLKLDKTVNIINPGVASVKIHPNGLYVASGGWDGRIRIFSWKQLKPLAVLDFHSETIQCLAFSQETLFLAAASKDGRISFWNLYNK